MQINKLLMTASAISLAVTSQAFAQTNASNDEIIVTGEKISRSLQDTATSVAVITALDIEERNIINILDVMNQTANVTSSNGANFTIRGINSTKVSGAGLGNLASVYIDGAPLSREALFVSPLDVWDMEQVEVFRGPQSTLQGRNALAGALILNTADPSYEWHGRARAIVSTGAKEKRLGLAFGGPLVEDQVAFRVAGEITDRTGIIENPTTRENADEASSEYLRLKLLVEPKAIPELSVLMSYTRDQRETGNNIRNLDVTNPYDNAQIFSDRENGIDLDLDVGVLNVDYDINDAFSLTSVTTYAEATRTNAVDSDYTAIDRESGFNISKSKTLTQELRLNIDKGPLTGVLGGYYSKEKTADDEDLTLALDVVNDFGLVNSLVGLLGLDVPTATYIASFYSDPLLVNSVSSNPREIKTKALFGDVTYQLNDTVRVFGGFRYDVENQQITTGNLVSITSTLPDPALFPAQLAPVIFGVNAFLASEVADATTQAVGIVSPDFGAFLPKIGVSFDVAEEQNLSFIVQRGYRSGGVGVNAARAQTFEFDQEYTLNYELSWRSRWLDNALTLNANAYYIDWTDQQVNVQLSVNVFDSETQNAAKSVVKGFEIESNYHVNDMLNIYGSVGFSDTEFRDFSAQVGGVQVDLSGNSFAFSPQWTLAAGFTWRNENGVFVNANGNYNSAAYRFIETDQAERDIESRVLVNAKVGWENDTYGVFVTAKNLLDEEYLSTYFSTSSSRPANMPEFGRYGQPQTFALQLEAKF